MATIMAEAETRQRLLRTVKKEVKQIMEEAVTRKFVHEDSSHIVSFCANRAQHDHCEKHTAHMQALTPVRCLPQFRAVSSNNVQRPPPVILIVALITPSTLSAGLFRDKSEWRKGGKLGQLTGEQLASTIMATLMRYPALSTIGSLSAVGKVLVTVHESLNALSCHRYRSSIAPSTGVTMVTPAFPLTPSAVEACVLHGLKRRAAGFLRSNKIAALFMKVGKSFVPAEDLCRKAQELEQVMETKRSQSMQSQDGLRKMPRLPSLSPQGVKNLWIRTALFEKVLDKIVLYLVENSSKYYEKEAVLMDNVDGPILASLLVGPCALEYSKMKTADHFWTDPSADELVQRHRIHGGHCRQDSPTKRPALCIQKRHSSSSMDERPSPSPSAREYVESLHQNSRVTLLFGKNNVLVQPRDDMEAIPGYLSMHQNADLMTLKWTPNQLMNGSVGDLDYECSVYWDYAMTIPLGEIVYLHCHQQVDSGGTVVLVSQDGIQRPPLRFPRGGHLLQFLSCLENGLLPHGQLDPPLWSQRGKGKVFPKLRNRVPQGSGSSDSVSDKEEDEATDYVFRILFPNSHSEFGILVVPKRSCSCPEDPPTLTGSSYLDQGATMWHPTLRKSSCSSCSHGSFSDGATPKGCNHERAPLKMLCDNMKNQIISRAFYGWLAYCRHLSTVRTHLSALVNHTIVAPDVPCDAYKGLTTDVWQTFLQDCTAYEEKDLLRLVYYGGVEASLRKEVWPFLLGHYQFGMSEAERKEVDEQVRVCYQQTMSEWLGCEEIVRQREKEQHAAAIAKCSSAASMDSPSQKMMSHHNSSVSNESQSSQSSDRQSLARLQSDSSSSTQVFESVEEVDPIETEPKSEEAKQVPKIPNGALQTGRALLTPDILLPATSPSPPAPQSPVKPADSEGLTEEKGSVKNNQEEEEKERGHVTRTEENIKTEELSNAKEETSLPAKTQVTVDESGDIKTEMPESEDKDALKGIEGETEKEGPDEDPTMKDEAQVMTESDESPSAIEMEEIPKAKVSMVPWSRKGRCEAAPHLEPGQEDEQGKPTAEEPEGVNLYPNFVSLPGPGDPKNEASSQESGSPFTQELLDLYTLNLHRIEKDVQRCDRNYWYFTPANLEKLRNIMCSYIWRHLDIGYVQGMCDLLAPLLVILDDEAMAFSCFTELMKRMNQNFPHGGAMDTHFANMRSLIQILDSEMFELMHQNGDYTHFYFCYRWFLLDFKRELVYDDVFAVWETIWAAKYASSSHFVLFIALALVEIYRDIILENNMDFTEIIKFFNEMAEHHNTKQILTMARDLVCKVQILIENK
ncbi:Small G protein signaling modulator 1 [Dissostichus eleginoides]|uniref:Small G protein signaling modulator 1 n=1 Tax=Dissostichus eleginoides TaxID=100907 RepID=A0AAD9C095_DISEL|nr:Small G protein signaling modulator 1 [Dissostichus eleginoides]